MAEINPIRYRGYYYDTETRLYYLKSRYYDPNIGRFINADNYACTRQGFEGFNLFTYCGDNPVSRTDSNGNDWELVGAGIQLDLSGYIGAASLGIGVEVVIYWGTKEAKDLGEPVVAIYIYGEGSVDMIDLFNIPGFAEDLDASITALKESYQLLQTGGKTALRSVIKTLPISVTISGFLVSANEQFKKAKDYEHWFDTASLSVGRYQASHAWSNCCKTYGLGVSFLGGNALIGASRGKAYYWLIKSSAQN